MPRFYVTAQVDLPEEPTDAHALAAGTITEWTAEPVLELACVFCNNIQFRHELIESEWSWQQWQCLCCGLWNDWKEGESI